MQITPEEWEQKKRHGYADHDRQGRPRVLTMDPQTGATILTTVEIIDTRSKGSTS